MSAVTVLGAGRMGAAIVGRLADAGWSVTVWNRSPEKARSLVRHGVTTAGTSDEALRGADVVVSVLGDGEAVSDVLTTSTLAAARSGAVVVEASTIEPRVMAEVAWRADALDVAWVSCALSGTPAVVAAGKAAAIVSGRDHALSLADPALDTVVARRVRVGQGPTEAKLIKIGVNALLAGTAQLLAESTVLVEAGGVTREVFAQAVRDSVLGSPFAAYKLAALCERDYTATFSTADLHKDVSLAIGEASAAGIELPFAGLLADLLAEACEMGWRDRDLLSLVPRLQARSGRPPDLPVLSATAGGAAAAGEDA